jgi:AcrR family transcriptional regulator
VTQANDPLTLRDRLLAATYACVARFGLAKTTIEDVVKESGVSRATIYRQFPGGRDELLLETVGWELGNFLNQLADHVRDAPNLSELFERGLAFAHQSVNQHAVLSKMMDTEPERLLPLLTTEARRTLPFIADFLQPYLRREAAAGRLQPGIDLDWAGDYLARAILSLIGAPGRWDLEDPVQAAELVRVELLGGILAA